MSRIPFNRAVVSGNEFEYMQQAIGNMHLSGDGPFTKKCHAKLESIIGAPKALLTTSCTHALEMAAFLLNIQPGDEVILPDFTFVSTVNGSAHPAPSTPAGLTPIRRAAARCRRTTSGK